MMFNGNRGECLPHPAVLAAFALPSQVSFADFSHRTPFLCLLNCPKHASDASNVFAFQQIYLSLLWLGSFNGVAQSFLLVSHVYIDAPVFCIVVHSFLPSLLFIACQNSYNSIFRSKQGKNGTPAWTRAEQTPPDPLILLGFSSNLLVAFMQRQTLKLGTGEKDIHLFAKDIEGIQSSIINEPQYDARRNETQKQARIQ